MRKTILRWLTGALGAVLCSGVSAQEILIYDFAAPYLQRTDKIFAGAGDAKDVNAATHVIDPWPYYVGNRRIPGNGERMVGAIERYRDTRKLPLAPPPIVPVDIAPSGFSSSGSGAGTAASGATAR